MISLMRCLTSWMTPLCSMNAEAAADMLCGALTGYRCCFTTHYNGLKSRTHAWAHHGACAINHDSNVHTLVLHGQPLLDQLLLLPQLGHAAQPTCLQQAQSRGQTADAFLTEYMNRRTAEGGAATSNSACCIDTCPAYHALSPALAGSHCRRHVIFRVRTSP